MYVRYPSDCEVRCTYSFIFGQDLWNLAKQEHRPYVGSTSSLTGMMSQIYFLISEDKEVNTNSLSRHFQYEVNYPFLSPFVSFC